ncbi:MAG: cobalamin-dependent protein [Prevotellaceae bacterium]|jgi:hypothetical protein|nr:cobalamin-dependent protein [Prevotellaceae bacterium]
MKQNNIDILFLDGFFSGIESSSFLGFIFPLGAFLKKYNYSYKILNMQLLPDYTIDCPVAELRKLNVKTIGISTHADNIKFVYDVVNGIKANLPNIPVILGGAQATFNGTKIMNLCRADVIVRNEGEKKPVQVLDVFIHGARDLSYIEGVTYRNKNDVIVNKSPPKII